MSELMIKPLIFDEMVSLRDAMNNLFEHSYLSPAASGSYSRSGRVGFAMNVLEDTTNYYVQASIPGVEPGKIDLSVKENTLTISGEFNYGTWPVAPNGTEEGEKKPAVRTLLSELSSGKFHRQIQLPGQFDFDNIQARYENGMLKLVLPKSARSQVKRIQVQAE